MNDDKLREVMNATSGRFAKAETLALAALRKAIITGTLAPGEEIDEEQIAAILDMSRMPIRQAMGVLESEGLVKRAYKRGVTVTELSAAEIEEIYHIRANLEGLAIRRSVPLMTDEHLARAEEALERINDKSDDDINGFVDANTQFHTMLYEPSDWDTLQTMIIRLRNNVARYVAISHHFIQQMNAVSADHQRILAACVRRDAELAEQLTRAHILSAMQILLSSFQQNAWVESAVARYRGEAD